MMKRISVAVLGAGLALTVALSGAAPAYAATQGGIVTLQSPAGTLWTVDAGGAHPTGQLLAPGTTAAVTHLVTGGNVTAFVDPGGVLWQTTAAGTTQRVGTGLPLVAAGTSPAVASDEWGGWYVAYHAQGTDHLWRVNGAGSAQDTGLVMATGASPAIGIESGLLGGPVEAYQRPDSFLGVRDSWDIDTVLSGAAKVADGTRPTIAVNPSRSWQIAFNGDDGSLWTFNHTTNRAARMPSRMAPGTSPAIAFIPFANDYEMVFVGPDGLLWYMAPNGGAVTGNRLAVEPGTSPALASSPSGSWEVAFEARDEHTLWLVNSPGLPHDTFIPMSSAAVPGISQAGV
jgi:hypothetical protein